jgi:hypothetical protein
MKDIIMTSTTFHSSIAILALVASASAFAGDRAEHFKEQAAPLTSQPAQGQRSSASSDPAGHVYGGMTRVTNNARPGQPGDGWKYFSDAAARRAVVISPQGDYFFSKGKGLMQVTGAGSRVGMTPVTNHAGPGQPGEGWKYFSDVSARRAVVIDPEGDYFLSKGKGLKQITGAGLAL